MKEYGIEAMLASMILGIGLALLSSAAVAERVPLPMLPYGDYVDEPIKPIQEGMKRYGWTGRESDNVAGVGYVLAALEDYKGHQVVVRIKFADGQLTFEPVSDRVLACQSGDCAVKTSAYTRWTTNLRRGIALAVHQLAIVDARREVWELDD